VPKDEFDEDGRLVLAARSSEASAFVSRVPILLDGLKENPPRLPRLLVTTGIGTSEGHARHLAEAATRWLGQPARFATTGSLAQGAPPHSDQDWLVVFSQGLSPNARHALRHIEQWAGVILVTGLRRAEGSAVVPPAVRPHEHEGARRDGKERSATNEGTDSSSKQAWLDDLESRGVIRVDMGCGVETGMLLRVIGARVGYAVAWSLLRTLAWRRVEKLGALDCDPGELKLAQDEAALEVGRVFPKSERIEPFFSAERTMILVAEGGMLELAEQLSLKLAEGMLRPQPRCIDVLHFAHGPLQGLATRPVSILYLSNHDSGGPDNSVWLERLALTLDPALHDLRVLCARLPLPFAVLEFEAMLDECVLRVLAETGLDLVDWPGADREDALYAVGPGLEDTAPLAHSRGLSPTRLPRPYEEAVWTDVEASIANGRRTAVIALGSIEQHGPHLPLGTDRFIADALARGLEGRLSDAIALPALAIGCASEHLDFSGTLHIDPATLEAVLGDLLGSLERHGFQRAFLFTAHGGNVDALDEMRPRLGAGSTGLVVRIATDLQVGSMQSRAVGSEFLDPISAGPHAGEYETSLVAMLRPGSVRPDLLRPGRRVTAEESQDLFYPSLRPNSESGVLGDPSAASADRGLRYLTAWLDLLEAAYRRAF
jgi:creatinine amidohydrolase